MFQKTLRVSLATGLLFSLVSCKSSLRSVAPTSATNQQQGSLPPSNPDSGGGSSANGDPQGDPPQPSESFASCGLLALPAGFSTNLSPRLEEVMDLALTITGSFEGSDSWSQISGNFDGMGLSLGLLQQNLGSGSLQPLLLKMRKSQPTRWAEFFASADLASIDGMLDLWSKSGVQIQTRTLDTGISPLSIGFRPALSSGNSQSVAWAEFEILNGTALKTNWSKELRSMAASGEYVGLQFSAALPLFNSALSYFNKWKFTELRSLLFFFDVMVQNNGFSAIQQNQFAHFLANSPQATETQKLNFLLNSLLQSVLVQWRSDVHSRKMSLIDGSGVVHGSHRNYAAEYCINPVMPL